MERRREELASHRFNMNVDLAGQTIGGTVIGVTGDPEICRILSAYAHEAGMGVSFKNQIWGSDSNSFAWKGIPAMTLNRDGFGMHTRHDTAALISAWSLERSSRLLAMVAGRLASAEVFSVSAGGSGELPGGTEQILLPVIFARICISAELPAKRAEKNRGYGEEYCGGGETMNTPRLETRKINSEKNSRRMIWTICIFF